MNLTEQFDKAYVLVSELLSQREGLIEAKLKAEQELADNDSALRKAISQRDEMSAALSIVPAKPKREKKDAEEIQQEQQSRIEELEGKLATAEALTEPRGGSDFFGATSIAEDKGDYFLVNGVRKW